MRIVAIGGGENGRPGTAYETGPFDREILSLTASGGPGLSVHRAGKPPCGQLF